MRHEKPRKDESQNPNLAKTPIAPMTDPGPSPGDEAARSYRHVDQLHAFRRSLAP